MRPLHEIIKEVMKHMSQKELGLRLGMSEESAQQNVSNMKRAPLDSDLERHWQLAAKLAKICEELGIDTNNEPKPAARPARLKLITEVVHGALNKTVGGPDKGRKRGGLK